MNRGKQVAYIAEERWKTTEYRKKVVRTVTEELIQHVATLNNFSLPDLVASVERFEEKVNTSAKTEVEYLDLVTAKVKSVHELSRKAAEARNQLPNPSGSATDANFDWPEKIYQELQILKHRYNAVVRQIYETICIKLQPSAEVVNSRELERFQRHKKSMECLFSVFELSKSQITPDMKYRPIEADRYIQGLLKLNGYTMPQSANVQSKQEAVIQINNQNQVSQEPMPGSQEKISAIDRLIKAMTSISPEALSEAVGEMEKAIQFQDKLPEAKPLNELPVMFDELGEPTFMIPEGGKRPRDFVIKTTHSPCNYANMNLRDGFNPVNDAAESDSSSFTFNAKRFKPVENENLLEEIKYINNRLIDCEVVIDKKENAERADTEEIEGIAVKVLFNAVSINQNLVCHFTSDKKSLMKPLRLVIPPSYPSSSLVILDELPWKASDDLRALFERAKAKLRFHLQSANEPFLIKDIARAWEKCAREAILDYAHANGGGTFSSMYGGWGACH